MRKNEATLHRLAEALLEREILDGEEIDRIIQGKALAPKGKKRRTAQRRKSSVLSKSE